MTGSISKSEIKTLGCEYHYAGYALDGAKRPVASFTKTGLEFHEYRQKYVEHLVDEMLRSDPEWVAGYLEKAYLSDDARDLIEADAPVFEIDPDAVYATELFLAMDADLNPMTGVLNPGPGKRLANGTVWAHGTIDRMEIHGAVARIDDYKTGFMAKIDPLESNHYALLVLANFPAVQTVEFSWEFIRQHHEDMLSYSRGDMPEMRRQIDEARTRRDEIERKHRNHEPLTVAPLAGLCAYCSLACPIRSQAAAGEVAVGPIQNLDDAKKAAGVLLALRGVQRQVEDQLKLHLATSGPIDLGNNYEAAIRSTRTRVLKLRQVLGVLGIEIPERAESFDVPLDSLRLGSTEIRSYEKAKKRVGMKELIDSVCDVKIKTELKVGAKKTRKEAEEPE